MILASPPCSKFAPFFHPRFWFIILSVLSGLAILYSAAIVMMPTTREAVLKRRFRSATALQIENLIRRIQIGDFLMIHLLGQNINVTSYCEVLHSLMTQLDEDQPGDTPSAPSTLEMAPIYPEIGKYGKDTAI